MKTSIMCIVLIGLLGISSVFAAGSRDAPEDVLRVGMELQYPPFEMSDEQGNPIGVSVEIAKALGDYLGKRVVIENIAWTGLIPSLQTGKVDIIISSMTITQERSQVVDFSDPYIRSGLTLLIAKDSPVQSFDDLNAPGRVVSVKSGTIGAIEAQRRLPLADVRIFEEVSACVLEVSQGKADAFIYDALTVLRNHQNNPDTTRIHLSSIPGTDGYWGMAIRKGNDSLRSQVNEFISLSRREGTFERLAEAFLGEEKRIFEEAGIPFFFSVE